jgi:DNA-binding beta-propeller fold protein YncE
MLRSDLGFSLPRRGVRFLRGCGAAVLLISTGALAMAASPPQSGPAKDGQPAWYIYQQPSPGPERPVLACAAEAAQLCSGQPNAQRTCLMRHVSQISGACKVALINPPVEPTDKSNTPLCVNSVICGPSNGLGITARLNPNGLRDGIGGYVRVLWKSDPANMGYQVSYPFVLPQGALGAASVAVDSKDNVWVFQRSPIGIPALTKYGPDHKMLFTLGDDVIGHQDKAHGMAIDAQDNVWFADESGATVKEVSSDGKLLRTLGVNRKRGDWDETKGQRLLWQPISVAFGPRGDIYIGEGHANESPNDVGSNDPANTSGAARVIHLDKNAKFINQWYGNMTGAGKFYQVHGLAVDPKNGDVWIGDREQYRFVVYTADGEFIKTIQMRNLTCNIAFDPHGEPWMGSGGDSQLLKIDRNGKVLGALGNGPGSGVGQNGETGYIAFDSKGAVYTGSTSTPRVTMWAPQKE